MLSTHTLIIRDLKVSTHRYNNELSLSSPIFIRVSADFFMGHTLSTMSPSDDNFGCDETVDMLEMKLNILKGKLAERETDLLALAADVRQRLTGKVSDQERYRQEERAAEACRRIRAMQSKCDRLSDRLFQMKQRETNDIKSVEDEDEKKPEQETEWALLETDDCYFKTRCG